MDSDMDSHNQIIRTQNPIWLNLISGSWFHLIELEPDNSTEIMLKIPILPINKILEYQNQSKGIKTEPHIYVYI